VSPAPAPKAPTATPKPPVAPAPPETRVALVIGNGTYSNVGSLPNARTDAEKIAATLRRVGFTTVTLSLDLPREKISEALQSFAALADRADWAMVYYAGHGIEFGGANYLIPTDAKIMSDRDISFEAVSLDQVMIAVEGAQKLRLVILDACRDNPFARTMRRTMPTRSLGRGLTRIEPEGATLVVFAAKDGQVANDGEAGGNSPFATAFAKHTSRRRGSKSISCSARCATTCLPPPDAARSPSSTARCRRRSSISRGRSAWPVALLLAFFGHAREGGYQYSAALR
jgi:hypothetical protein